MRGAKLDIHPLTPGRWDDFETLFGERGAYGGCWCMWWRCTRKEFEANQGEKNRKALKSLVDGGSVPGLIGYVESKPAVWCALGPREDFPSIGRSRILKPIDDVPTWSLPCLFVGQGFRGQGAGRKSDSGRCRLRARPGWTGDRGLPDCSPRGQTSARVQLHGVSGNIQTGRFHRSRPAVGRPHDHAPHHQIVSRGAARVRIPTPLQGPPRLRPADPA